MSCRIRVQSELDPSWQHRFAGLRLTLEEAGSTLPSPPLDSTWRSSLGHGPEALTDIEGAGPYVRENHVARVSCWNDPRTAEWFARDALFASALHLFDVERARRDGADHIPRQARRVRCLLQ